MHEGGEMSTTDGTGGILGEGRERERERESKKPTEVGGSGLPPLWEA